MASPRRCGIEVAPFFAPLAPKREGYNCLVLDVFDKQVLLACGEDDPNVPAEGLANIEAVDFVGSATEIAELVPLCDHGSFDYIVSSHNFEHLPNPIRFLQGCAKVLKTGGILSMAIPDGRACFDCFRPYTTLGEWLTPYRSGAAKPSAVQIFEFQASSARICGSATRRNTRFPLTPIRIKLSWSATFLGPIEPGSVPTTPTLIRTCIARS